MNTYLFLENIDIIQEFFENINIVKIDKRILQNIDINQILAYQTAVGQKQGCGWSWGDKIDQPSASQRRPIYAVLAQSEICREIRIFLCNFLGPNIYLCYFLRFTHLWVELRW